jgi:phosphoserine phosphatase
MSLAIFDLDNTLIAGDSDHAWGEFLAAKGIVDDDYRQRNERFYQQYIAGTLAIEEYLAFAAEPLRNRSMSQLQRWHQQFMAKMIAPLLLPKAAAILDKHRQHGDCLLIITSTNRFVIATPALLPVRLVFRLVKWNDYINGSMSKDRACKAVMAIVTRTMTSRY